MVGAGVGERVGERVGSSVGGIGDGCGVGGAGVGSSVGAGVGERVGSPVGAAVGSSDTEKQLLVMRKLRMYALPSVAAIAMPVEDGPARARVRLSVKSVEINWFPSTLLLTVISTMFASMRETSNDK